MYKLGKLNKKLARPNRRWLIVLAVIALVALAAIWKIRTSYDHNLQPVSSSTTSQYFTVTSGESLDQIAHGLQGASLIRDWKTFEAYVRINELRSELEAGTYSFSPSMSTPQIANKIADGETAKNLVTILPGTRLDQIKTVLTKAGYTATQASEALDRSNYASDSALASLPAGKSLEGYLYPDSFQKDFSTSAVTIVRMSIDEMGQKLTPAITAGFKQQGLSTYQGVTLASIVEQESGSVSDDPIIAQVFLSRLKIGMPLGSDVTARYASAIAGKPFSVSINSPYNTRIVKGLPPGPIGSVTTASLQAVASPTHTSYLYFVTGDNGVTYFSYTEAQHNALIQKYCIKSCN